MLEIPDAGGEHHRPHQRQGFNIGLGLGLCFTVRFGLGRSIPRVWLDLPLAAKWECM